MSFTLQIWTGIKTICPSYYFSDSQWPYFRPRQLRHKPNQGQSSKWYRPQTRTSTKILVAASASSPNDIWAVGQSTIHFDGTKWTAFPAPFIDGVDNAFLTGRSRHFSDSRLGSGKRERRGENLFQQVIEQWDGIEWSVFPGPNFPPNSQAASVRHGLDLGE